MQHLVRKNGGRRAPDGFVHYAKIGVHSIDGHVFLKKLNTFYPQNGPCLYVEMEGSFLPVPLTGPVNYAGIDMYIENKEKQGYVYIWSKGKDDFTNMLTDLQAKVSALEPPERLLYHQDCYGNWYASDTYDKRSIEAYIGYQEYVDRINKDIVLFREHHKLLKSIGENKSLNYLLFGPPGTGKTTLIMTIASLHNIPVYVVGKNARKSVSLTPPKGKHEDAFRILLFEDFDRCLENPEHQKDGSFMSDVLNTLDGVNSGESVIRFFTGNDCKVIFHNNALINRMSARFEFHMPTRDMMEAKLAYLASKLKPEIDIACFAPFLDAVAGKITMRPFTSYVLRYIFDDNPLSSMMKNIQELVKVA
jgi:hypothetical protein